LSRATQDALAYVYMDRSGRAKHDFRGEVVRSRMLESRTPEPGKAPSDMNNTGILANSKAN
jgi:hypothetical protein